MIGSEAAPDAVATSVAGPRVPPTTSANSMVPVASVATAFALFLTVAVNVPLLPAKLVVVVMVGL